MRLRAAEHCFENSPSIPNTGVQVQMQVQLSDYHHHQLFISSARTQWICSQNTVPRKMLISDDRQKHVGYGYPDLALTDCSGQGDLMAIYVCFTPIIIGIQ